MEFAATQTKPDEREFQVRSPVGKVGVRSLGGEVEMRSPGGEEECDRS